MSPSDISFWKGERAAHLGGREEQPWIYNMLGTHHCDRAIFPPDISPLLRLMPPCPDVSTNSSANGATCPYVHFSFLSRNNFFCGFFFQQTGKILIDFLQFLFCKPCLPICVTHTPHARQYISSCTCFPSFPFLCVLLWFLCNATEIGGEDSFADTVSQEMA